jgi:diguanylate cyclase (GGDEF)-like protein
MSVAAGVLGLLGLLRAERAARDARVDAKTGVLTSGAWTQAADRRLARTRRRGASAAILMVDVDDFKSVNDRDGHLAGDAVLARIGRCLTECIRGSDLVGRFGGDEFAALLDDVDVNIAERVAARVRDQVAALGSVTVSVGIAVLPPGGSDLASLLASADRALYADKAGHSAKLRRGLAEPP